MNEQFCFQRFWTYFKYDIVQMWRNHGKAALLLGGAGVILYVVYVLSSLVFPDHVWEAPGEQTRAGVYAFASMLFVLFQARTYGYLTEKRAGSAWLMLPASSAEKTLSMLLMTLLVLPLAFLFVYLGSDALLCLLDPGMGNSLLSSFNLAELQGEEVAGMRFPLSLLLFFMQASILTYFLLCGLIFKKWKISGGIAVLFGLMTLLVFILAALAESNLIHVEFSSDLADDSRTLAFLWTAVAVCFLTWAALAWGVYRRVKTIKH